MAAGILSVGSTRELQAAVLAFKAADREVKTLARKEFRQAAGPIWQAEIGRRASSPLERAVYLSAKPTAVPGNPPELRAATSRRARSGGLRPADDYGGVEFGADRSKQTTYRRRNRSTGGSHTVTRHTQRQFPPKRAKGRVAWQALPKVVPKVAAIWVRSIVDAYVGAAAERVNR